MKCFGCLIIFLGLAALGFLILDSAPAPHAWTKWPPDYCRAVNCYCEPIRDRLIAQPIAAYSNLGFILAGSLILWATARSAKASPLFNLIQQEFPLSSATPITPAKAGVQKTKPNWIPAFAGMSAHIAYPLVYGAALISTGLFSFFYHASLTKVGDYFDLMGMYLFTSYLMLYNLARWRPLPGRMFAIVYAAINVALALGLAIAYELQQVYFGILIAVALLAEVIIQIVKHPHTQLRYLIAALACFSLGAAVWIWDSQGLLPCTPTAPITWHALWHLAAAAAAGLLYLHWRKN